MGAVCGWGVRGGWRVNLSLWVFVEAARPPEPALPPLSPRCSTLSTCCHAMVAAIYPFTWQHTYIPVLPPAMIDIVCSPTPFLIGLLTSSLPLLRELPLEEVSSLWGQGRGEGPPVALAAGRVRGQRDPTALSVSQHPPAKPASAEPLACRLSFPSK